MGEVVNLRTRRKAKQREERDQTAQESRILHGLSKAQRAASERQRSETERKLEGHKLESRTKPTR